MRNLLALSMLGCSHRDRTHEAHVEVTTPADAVHLDVRGRTGLSPEEDGSYRVAVPSYDEWATAEELVSFTIVPNSPGPHTLYNGELRSRDLGSLPVLGLVADVTLDWTGDAEFPVTYAIELSGTLDEGAVSGHLTMTPTNCKSPTSEAGATCGEVYDARDAVDVTWAEDFLGCDAALVDAVVGAERTGRLDDKRIDFGPRSLDCARGYDDRVICGADPYDVDVEGCSYAIYEWGSPGADGTWNVQATDTCDEGAPRSCEARYLAERPQ